MSININFWELFMTSAPVFAAPVGVAQEYIVNEAITVVSVPEATGDPTPTYAVVGVLPAGISFEATARTLSGTPTEVGSGVITIRATNSEGEADWTVNYNIAAAAAPPAPPAPVVKKISFEAGLSAAISAFSTIYKGFLSSKGTIVDAEDSQTVAEQSVVLAKERVVNVKATHVDIITAVHANADEIIGLMEQVKTETSA